MSIVRCDGCGRMVDTDFHEMYEREYVNINTGKSESKYLCLQCDEKADEGWSLDQLGTLPTGYEE